MKSISRLTIGLLAGLAIAAPALRAETFVLGPATGADYDAVGDGWFFAGPTQPPPDGVGDSGNQALAVGLISGVLELRALSEFPLATLSGITASQIVSATVTVTIDDVVGSFGPGATFDGTASDPIAAYHYPADGTVTVADFSPAGLGPLGLVNPGLVTDASLAVSGALPFSVDATNALKAALTNDDTAFGLLLGTTDSPTATSFDDLSPPGVAGGALPTLTIVTIPLTPPVLSSDAQKCQAAVAKSGAKLVATAHKSFSSCFGLVLKDFAPDEVLSSTTATKCASGLAPADPTSKLGKALARFVSDLEKKCPGVTPADIGSPCNPSATTIAQMATCIRDANLASAEVQVSAQYAAACAQLGAVGLDTAFPGICTP